MVTPNMAVTKTRTRKMKKRTFATDAAPAAIPVNPKMAAITAIIKNIAVHFNIRFALGK